jgi:DNA (cytosine-5)-methyltransferase 1
MLNGLSLFSGCGGIDLAIREYVRPIIYCEKERFAQGILLSRMDDGVIPFAPIWDDVTTLDANQFKGMVDLVYGGFPCQDISEAGKGAGLAGKRSSLFKEIVRICQESTPLFIFLENVSAIRTRGSIEVQEDLASIGYDTRWLTLSASEVGANHKRERWFCLAKKKEIMAYSEGHGINISKNCDEQERKNSSQIGAELFTYARRSSFSISRNFLNPNYWQTEPNVDRVVDGIPFRSHRIKALGNSVVPLQVKTAFEILIGITSLQETINV